MVPLRIYSLAPRSPVSHRGTLHETPVGPRITRQAIADLAILHGGTSVVERLARRSAAVPETANES